MIIAFKNRGKVQIEDFYTAVAGENRDEVDWGSMDILSTLGYDRHPVRGHNFQTNIISSLQTGKLYREGEGVYSLDLETDKGIIAQIRYFTEGRDTIVEKPEQFEGLVRRLQEVQGITSIIAEVPVEMTDDYLSLGFIKSKYYGKDCFDFELPIMRWNIKPS